jgi:diphosphomevalonate decarboxylase
MSNRTATAFAYSNIALIKYWGDCDPLLRTPANGSISMNLAGLETRTRVTFDPTLPVDRFRLNEVEQTGPALERVAAFLERVRQMAGLNQKANVESHNNFPAGAGLASSASAFAALAVAAAAAAGLSLSERELARLARLGSGSACRSVPGGYVEWLPGCDDESSYAVSIAPPEHWRLVDCVAIISQAHKVTSSTTGHALAPSSPLQSARVADAARRLELCRRAILERDFPALAEIVELDSNLMHAVMMTSTPPLLYWQPATVAVMQAVQAWRADGLEVCYTIDAGPNVHVLCPASAARQVAERLAKIPGVQAVLSAHPGGPARLVAE